MTFFSMVLFIGALVYVLGASVIIFSLRPFDERERDTKPKIPFVSVVIAAHNEQAPIGFCLASLAEQDYPADSYEIIVADDRSTDRTSEVAEQFRDRFQSISIISIADTPSDISPKKNALLHAIAASKGDIIVQTDADCIVPQGWITGMAGSFGSGVGIVAGLSPYLESSGNLNSFIRHEYLWNAALMAGSISLGRGTHATGRNLAFLRRAFDAAGGYGASSSVMSGDDTLLLHRIQAVPEYHAAVITDPTTHVTTRAPETFREFLRQRIRHMSTGRRFSPSHILIASVIYSFHILLLAGAFVSIFYHGEIQSVILAFALKCIIDAVAATRITVCTGLVVQWRRFILNECFLLLYLAAMPVLGMLIPVRWKENS